ncbi:MAG: hypothetical protein R3215_02195 [Halomonas sp.]|nr:hypothetical protein [Halomonas sp.]
MRRWIAALALVPALAWGQEIDCNAELPDMYRVVDEARQIKSLGGTKRQIIEHASQQDDQFVRDLMIEAANGVYSTLDFSDDDIVQQLDIICREHNIKAMRERRNASR